MLNIIKFLLTFIIHIQISSNGNSSCSCISSNSQTLSFTQSGTTQNRDNSTQGIGCSDHDSGLAPFCDSSPPSFCSLNWCQVDETNCAEDDQTLSGLFADTGLYYSQKTCGDEQNFAKFITNSTKTSFELKTMVEDQVDRFRDRFNGAMEEQVKDCSVVDSCGQFTSNPNDTTWLNQSTNPDTNMKVNFNATAVSSPSAVNSSDSNQRLFTCESKALEQEFLATARLEQKEADTSRIAQMQGAEINQGNFVQWPVTETCSSAQDPRQRDWFSTAATGPKDVIILIDTSGSMSTRDRQVSARIAAKAILDTLTEFDQAGLILFQSTASKFNSTLVQMTVANKAAMKTYIDNNVIPFGGTNFEDAFDQAFDVIKDSYAASATSTCLRAILFLTDGEAELDVDALVKRNEEQDFKIFSQALGSGADTKVTKDLSCKTDAISQQIPDGGNLADYMAGQFHYFASGIKDLSPRWIQQNDIITDEPLLSACVSLQDGKLFKGVTCMDMNVILELSVLQAKPDQNSAFVPALTNSNAACPIFSYDSQGIGLEMLRKNSGGDLCNTGTPLLLILIIIGAVCCCCCISIGLFFCFAKTNGAKKKSSSSSAKKKKKSSSSSAKRKKKKKSSS